MRALWFRCAGSLNDHSRGPSTFYLSHFDYNAVKHYPMFSGWFPNVVCIRRIDGLVWIILYPNFFSCHLKALELLQGLHQPEWLVFSHPVSSVRHSPHNQCRGFLTLASRGCSSFTELGWIPLLSPEVLSTLKPLHCFNTIYHLCCGGPITGIISRFCRFEGIGIYVVMFWEIMNTLVRIVMLFIFLMLAFSLAFYALMLNQVGEEIK